MRPVFTMPSKKIPKYNDLFPAEDQISMEEKIASILFMTTVCTETCAQRLSQSILREVLFEFRPDFFGAGYLAQTRWSPHDVQSLAPNWSLKRCKRFLQENERKLQDAFTTYGWEVLESWVVTEQCEEQDAKKKANPKV